MEGRKAVEFTSTEVLIVDKLAIESGAPTRAPAVLTIRV